MKKNGKPGNGRAAWTVAAVLAAVMLCFAGCPEGVGAGPDPVYAVSGTISIRNDDGDPAGVPGAAVQLKRDGTETGPPVTTGADGTYTIPGVAAGGGYTLTVTRAGYKPLTINVGTVSVNVSGKDGILRPYDVYIAGCMRNTGNQDKAILWKNRIPYPLTEGINDTQAWALAVQYPDTIYFGGFEYSAGNKARYWKYGDADGKDLSAANKKSVVNAVAVRNADVYFAGYDVAESNAGSSPAVAIYWKNGASGRTELTTAAADAKGIALSGDDVYVVGFTGSGTGARAVYWKNGGTAIPFSPQGARASEARGIAVSDSGIYVAGFERTGSSSSTDAAKYWKINGTDITAVAFNSGEKPAQANAVTVADGDVYAVGFENFGNGEKNAAVCWINGGDYQAGGKTVKLTDGSAAAQAYSAAVAGDAVYIAGTDKVGNIDRAMFWKVDRSSYAVTSVPLSDGTKTASARAVAVITE